MDFFDLKNITGKKVILFFIFTAVIYVFMEFYTVPKLMTYSGGMKIIDLKYGGYSFSYVKALFINLKEEGRHFYLYRQLPLDMIFPVFYGIFGVFFISYLLQKISPVKNKYHNLKFLPLSIVLFDYAENIFSIIMLLSYPYFFPFLVKLTSIFTVLKSFCLLITLAFVLFCSIKLVDRYCKTFNS